MQYSRDHSKNIIPVRIAGVHVDVEIHVCEIVLVASCGAHGAHVVHVLEFGVVEIHGLVCKHAVPDVGLVGSEGVARVADVAGLVLHGLRCGV